MKPSGNDTREVLRIVPSSGFSRPAIMLMIVVLPVPLPGKDAQRIAQFDTERRAVKDHLALRSRSRTTFDTSRNSIIQTSGAREVGRLCP